jgi:hypothetical protein
MQPNWHFEAVLQVLLKNHRGRKVFLAFFPNSLDTRAVVVMHKQLEGMKSILARHAARSIRWTASMKQDYFEEDSGFEGQ